MIQEFDNTQALIEGWGIFITDDDAGDEWFDKYGRYSLDSCCNPEIGNADIFGDDADEVWRFVVRSALDGSRYHQSAIRFLRHHNPKEIEFIRERVPEIDHLELMTA